MQQLTEQSQQEYDRVQQQLKEIEMLIQQTSGEVDRLVPTQCAGDQPRQAARDRTLTLPPFGNPRSLQRAAGCAEAAVHDARPIGKTAERPTELSTLCRASQATFGGRRQPHSAPRQPRSRRRSERIRRATVVRIIEAQEQERQRLVRQIARWPRTITHQPDSCRPKSASGCSTTTRPAREPNWPISRMPSPAPFKKCVISCSTCAP